MIDDKPPETHMHLHLNLKKLQMEEERHGVVERDNHILLDKMAHIMRTKGRVDNVNNYEQRRSVITSVTISIVIPPLPCICCVQSEQDSSAEGLAESDTREPGHPEEDPVQRASLQPHSMGEQHTPLGRDSIILHVHLLYQHIYIHTSYIHTAGPVEGEQRLYGQHIQVPTHVDAGSEARRPRPSSPTPQSRPPLPAPPPPLLPHQTRLCPLAGSNCPDPHSYKLTMCHYTVHHHHLTVHDSNLSH